MCIVSVLDMMEAENSVYPLSRSVCTDASQYQYAYSNPPTRDMLQNYAGKKEPMVLLLDGKDIHSCFYTIWKNLDPHDIPAQFDGVHFVLNNASATVLARNILILFLCHQMPKEDSELKKWLCGMWAIWYCHELYPDHVKLLHDSLDALCKYSKDWPGSDNPLRSIVRFTSPATLSEVSGQWETWRKRNVPAASAHALRSAIKTEIRENYPTLNAFVSTLLTSSVEIPFGNCTSPKRLAAQKSEISAYVNTGNAFAENVLGLTIDHLAVETAANVTIYEKKDGVYSLHCSSIPFNYYYQVAHFSSDQQHASNSTRLMVADQYFKVLPLLANSFQQFSLWLQCSHKVLTLDKNPHVTFTFGCSLSSTFFYELGVGEIQEFDIIDSSNINAGIADQVLPCILLLEGNGLLYTRARYNVQVFPSAEKYLTSTFGFPCKLFPVLLGVCCINHEGESYTSPVMVQPCQVTSTKSDLPFREKRLLWKKVESTTLPQIFPSDQGLNDTVANALSKAFEGSIIALLKRPLGMGSREWISIETTVKLLQVFISNARADFGPLFWKPLAELLKKKVKPYLSSIQVHFFLHGVHMHLAVTEEDCPMCLGSPLSSKIGLFSASLETKASSEIELVAFVHKEECNDPHFLSDIARKDGDVQFFDCTLLASAQATQFFFYAPLELAARQYKVTVISVASGPPKPYFQTQPLTDLVVPFASFKFFQVVLPRESRYALESFGEVTLHISDGDSSDVVIETSVMSTSDNQAGEKLMPERLASNIIQLCYGKHACKLVYPYCIAYDKVKIKMSKKKGFISVCCPRAIHELALEEPLYTVSPEKELAFLSLQLSKEELSSFTLAYQFMNTNRSLPYLMHMSQDVSRLSLLIRLKLMLIHLFTLEAQCYRFINTNSNSLTVLLRVNNRLFDYESKAPVLDVAYCFDEVFLPSHESIENIPVDDVEYNLLKKALSFFAKRTICTVPTSCHQLGKRRNQEHFTRALVSLLPQDPDHDHQPNSSVAKVPPQKCNICCELCEATEMCSQCETVRCCSEECRQKHWKINHATCKKLSDDTVTPECQEAKKLSDDAVTSESQEAKKLSDDAVTSESQGDSSQSFPLCRYWYSGSFRFYYAYGNTAAEDLLQHTTGVKNPAILLLGCGDIRSCFYTLWRHFDPSFIPKAPRQFDGVKFVLNDWSSAVLARNILFLYMCLKLPRDKQARKKWLSAMWAIWYCHELYPDHQKALDDCLRFLLEKSLSADHWASSSENPLSRLVHFTNSNVLNRISIFWRTWLERKVGVHSVQHMHSLRSSELQKHHDSDPNLIAFSLSHSATFINGDSANGEKTMTRMPEILAYLKNGNCFAESVLDLKLKNLLPTSVNSTLFERDNGVYSVHYGSMPYSGYYHTVNFSPTHLASSGVAIEVCNSLLVQSKVFKSHPLLANSVQQFTMWVQSASEILSEGSTSISFLFNDQHAESTCQEFAQGHSQFDLIHTSNLIDHMSPANVILSTLPLLKQEGLLLTTTLLHRRFTEVVEEFLSLCFGFDCSLLPVILGIRCINHEGPEYSSPIMVEPTPVDAADMTPTNQNNRLLLWKKVRASPLVFPQLPALESGNITDALANTVQVSAYALLTKSAGGRQILNNSCIETAIYLLQTFRACVNSNSDYKFWEPLSQMLIGSIKPFLSGFQTQAHLHNLHIHLTVDESSCPICKGSPLQDTIGQFRAEVSLPIPFTPHFMIIVHKCDSSDATYLCSEANQGKDVHIFDCINAMETATTLNLKFFAPLIFIKRNYNATIARTFLGERSNLIKSLFTTSMSQMKIKFSQYDFAPIVPSHQTSFECREFGEIVSHICDGNGGHLKISLGDSATAALTTHKLRTGKPTSNELELSCGSFCCSLKFKYPIDYSKVKIKQSKVRKSIEIAYIRKRHEFDCEDPVYIASPDHQLALPPQHVSEEIMVCHSGIQLSNEERKIADSHTRSSSPISPLVYVKTTLMYLFQYDDFFFHFTSPMTSTSGMVIVNKHLFDYQCKAPALDLAFCFLDTSNAATVRRAWDAITRVQTSRRVLVDDPHNTLLKRVLVYFSKRTNVNSHSARKPNSRFEILHQYKIDKHFTRAVVYLLYRDPDRRGREMATSLSSTSSWPFPQHSTQKSTPPTWNTATAEKCGYCGKYSSDTKKCARCRKVCYCDKTCQTNHWPEHKLECKTHPHGP